MPHLGWQDEQDLLDAQGYNKIDTKLLSDHLLSMPKFKSKCLKLIVPENREIHDKLQPPPPPPPQEPQFIPPEPRNSRRPLKD